MKNKLSDYVEASLISSGLVLTITRTPAKRFLTITKLIKGEDISSFDFKDFNSYDIDTNSGELCFNPARETQIIKNLRGRITKLEKVIEEQDNEIDKMKGLAHAIVGEELEWFQR